ncbi:MAG TPA: hypothetical protein VGF82_20860 [Terracidiphilus sp.]|jgi:hypothetical protein
MKVPWRNLDGPARYLAASGTVLLVASALGAVEAAVVMILGPASDIVVKPFVIAGYLEACAGFFSVMGIAVSFICLVFYRPYLLVREKILIYRAHHAGQVSDEHTWFEPAYQAPGHFRDEDGSPD